MDKPEVCQSVNGGASASRGLPPSPYDPAVRRRTVRMAWILVAIAVCCLCTSYFFVRAGWIRPGPVIWRFPWDQHGWQSNF